MTEVWKDVKGFEGMYQVSNLGRIKSLEREVITKKGYAIKVNESILKGSKDTKGYLQVEFKKDGKRIIRFIHRIVAEAFIPNVEHKEQVNHKNGNKLDNYVGNLEWATCKENIEHAWKNNLNTARCGEKHANSKLTDEQARYIKENYKAHDKQFGARALARKFNISVAPIVNIVSGKGWKHI